jgi:hypothetical protein
MKTLILKTLFIPLAILACWTQSFAAEGRHALIIGIGQYSEASNTTTLEGIPMDMINARRMAKEMGIPNEAIVELRDSRATKQNIQNEFKKMAEKVKPGDRVFIYHSGHGTRYAKGNVCLEGLQTYTKGKFTYDDILSEAEIAAYTKPISEKADKVLMIVDTCFSGGVINSSTRSLGAALKIRPKFNANNTEQCPNVGINQPLSRNLLGELKRFGIHEENFVQIAAANNKEVSWDDKTLGGLATHALTQCLTGEATDFNKSGGISLDEVRACAQVKLNSLMKPHEKLGMLPSTIQIKGNRNLIPVAVQKPPVEVLAPVQVALAPPPPATTPAMTPPQVQPEPIKPAAEVIFQVPISETKPPATTAPAVVAEIQRPPLTPPPAITPLQAQPEPVKPPSVVAVPPQTQLEPAKLPAATVLVTPAQPPAPLKPVQIPPKPPAATPAEMALASLATLKDIEQQRNPNRQIDVKLAKTALKIGKDSLDLTIKSSHDGYVYMVLLGSDAKSFLLFFPNGYDKDNRIEAGKTLQLPKIDWQLKAHGPVGTHNILVMVSDTARKLDKLVMADPTSAEPFTYALNDIGGRTALINFLTGTGIDGRSESFAAKLLTIKEVQ